MKYTPVSYITFANHLFETEDLDPVYVGLHKLNLPTDRLYEWLLSYWCFYHAGVSCLILDTIKDDGYYWSQMNLWAGMKAAPRGIERRHFRGEQAVKAIEYLRDRYETATDAVEDLLVDGTEFYQIAARVQRWPLFGPWIAFKVADMLERCTNVHVNFSDCELGIYKEPVAGAKLIADIEQSQDDLKGIIGKLLIVYSQNLAPPRYDRPVNIQEIETILCKFKSHYNGHYPLGKDTAELADMLYGWGSLAKSMKTLIPHKGVFT